MSDLSIRLSRIATHPMWMTYEEHEGDRAAIAEAAQILRGLTTEHGLRAPDGIVITVHDVEDDRLTAEQIIRKRVHDAPDYWTGVTRKVAATEWEPLP